MNDTLGHPTGDIILKKTAGRLLSCVRETDTVARFGGDEFLILLTNIRGQKEIEKVGKEILEKMAQPFQLKKRDVFLGASIGITIAPDDGDDVNTLMKNVDMAMYKVKGRGRNGLHFFSEHLEKTAKNSTLMEWDLRRAVKNQEIVVYYQPVVDLSSLKTVSLEALVRWKHPHQGLVPPDQFIPIAEHSDLICEIGEWVLQSACTQMKHWQEHYDFDASLSVNVSTRQFKYDGFWSSLTMALDKSQLETKYLTLEITESMMLDPGGYDAVNMLRTLKKLGVKVSIDDFGTGYSSLSYLSQYPIDLLKIDQSFIKGISEVPEKRPLVEAIVLMAQSLNLKVIAEGIETHEDLSYLMDLGCDKGQGYYFSKPLSSQAYEKILRKQTQEIRTFEQSPIKPSRSTKFHGDKG